MDLPENLRYTSEHEWLLISENEATIGITDFAQEQLGDVVYIELPDIGTKVKQGETFGTIESVKAVSDLFSPGSGEVVDRNESLTKSPELVNESPYEKGWLIKVRIDDTSELENLLDAKAYQREIKSD